MKKILSAAITIIMAALTIASCDDFLEVESPSSRPIDNFYKNPTKAEQGLRGIYNGLLPVSQYYLLMSDGRSDDVWTQPATDKPRDYVDISVFNPNIYTISTLNGAWSDYYEIIARANLFLQKVEPLEMTTTTDGVSVKTTFMAEARFLRAFAYFDLVRFFGRVPVSLKPLTDDEAMSTPQSETKDVYEQVIVPDLRFAIDSMQENAYTADGKLAQEGRATKVAAQALLGKVYATMSGFPLNDTSKKDSALILMKEVIDYADKNNKFWAKDGDEWQRIWISDNDNKYHIFEIQYIAEKNYGNPIVYLSVPDVPTDYVSIKMSGNRISCATGLRELFKKNSDDIRYAATVDDSYGSYFTKFFEHKIKRKALGYGDIDGQIIDRTYFPINYPLIRLEDVMLLYAELAGPTQEAIALVNRIRVRAGLKELSGEELTAGGFLSAVKDERRRELAFEGIRWFDIVRRNEYRDAVKAKFMREATDADGNIIRPTYVNYADNVREGTYLYPIPDKQMKAREGLYQQNEAYR